MQFKKGNGWKACYDEERNLYTAQRSQRGFYELCEINKEAFDKLGTDGADDWDAEILISKGRKLFESDDDYYTMPYYIVRDEDYHELAPWSSAKWIAEKTDVLNKRDRIAKRFPGISFAFRDSEGSVRKQYFGVFDIENHYGVDQSIAFPACAISKFITAVCIMKMHEMRTVNIDEPVNAYLSRWKLLTPEGRESDASIRSILSHTSGIVDGEDSFHGLRMGDPEISLLAILDGETKYNNRPVRAEKPQGTSFAYSNAGYCVLQQMMQDVTGRTFEDVVQELVFDKLGLKDSFYAVPGNIEKYKAKMAIGYAEDKTPIPGKYPVIPDLAASGLWSTPEDLIMIAAEFLMALKGESAFLQKKTALEMAKPAKDFPRAGLGLFLDGSDILVSKGWGRNGQCMMKMNIGKGEISVVMTNMDPGANQAESGVEWLVDSYIYFM